MAKDILRSYQKDFLSGGRNFQKIGLTGGYPLIYFTFGESKNQVMITGGVHGDEPAGAYAALHCREIIPADLLKQFTFHVIPCVNPWGFEHHTRENAKGIDLNRDFAKFISIEARIVRSKIDELKNNFVFSIDMHEGSPNKKWKNWSLEDNPDGAWIYELCHGKEQRIGQILVQTLQDHGHAVCKYDTIFDDLNNGGVIHYPEGMKNFEYKELSTLDAWLWSKYTQHAFTTETCTDLSLEERMVIHHKLLVKALELFLERSGKSDKI